MCLSPCAQVHIHMMCICLLMFSLCTFLESLMPCMSFSYLIVGLPDQVAPRSHTALKSCSLVWIFLQLSVSPRDKISRSRISRSPETHVFMVFDTICQILLSVCVYTCLCVVYGGLCLCLWGVCDVWCEACV